MFHAWTSQTCTKCGSSLVIQSASWAISKNLSSSCRSLARIHRKFEIRPRNPPSATVVKARTGGAFLSGSVRVNWSRSRSALSDRWTCEAPIRRTTARTERRIFLSRGVMVQRPHSLSSLGGGQFAAAEDHHAADAGNPSEEQNNLSHREPKLTPTDAAASAQVVDRGKIFGQLDHCQHAAEDWNNNIICRRMAARAFLGIPTHDGAVRHGSAHGSAGENYRQQAQREESGHREGEKTRRGQADRSQQSHPAVNDAQTANEVQPKLALRIKHFHSFFQREEQRDVVYVGKRDREDSVLIVQIGR